MRKNLRLLLFLLLSLSSLSFVQGQQNTDFAVELAAFDQSVPLSYFKGISKVYETFDVNQIYRYHIAAATKTEAETILQQVKQSGFPNARIIDFAYIKSVCEAKCGYIAPTPTGKNMLGAAPPLNNTSNNNTANNNSIANNTTNNNNNLIKKSTSLDAASLLGENVVTYNGEDDEWLSFLDRNKDLGLTEAELLAVYKKHGNFLIIHADWFDFKNKNKDLEASNADLMELFIRHGNIKLDVGIWIDFKKEKGDNDVDFLDFLQKNADLGATDAELRALYAKHGNIKISQAIWFYFKSHPEEYRLENNNNNNIYTTEAARPDVQTIGFIMFEFGGTILSNTTTPELDKVAIALIKNKNLRIELTGHADAVGNAVNNKALSLRRATTIQQYFINKGVDKSRIKVSAKGEDTPIAINNNTDGSDCPEGRKYNRRVDLGVMDPDGNEVKIVSSIKIPAHLLMR
jgi:outer membrane protein OmpA-like peptidoglycan-associated protein